MWEGVWCEESRCPDVQYSCIYVSVTPQSSVHGKLAIPPAVLLALLDFCGERCAISPRSVFFHGLQESSRSERVCIQGRACGFCQRVSRVSWGKGNFCHRTMTAVSMHGWKGVKEFLLGCQCCYGRS